MNKSLKLSVLFHTSVAITLLLIISACSSGPDVEIPEEIAALENVKIVPISDNDERNVAPKLVARFGDTDEAIIGRLGVSAIDSNDKVYIADTRENVIHVYNADGEYLQELGRRGDGPGEFRRISYLQVDDEYLHILDGNKMQFTRYRLDDYEYNDTVQFSYNSEIVGGYMRYPESFEIIDSESYFIKFGLLYITGVNIDKEAPNIEGVVYNRKNDQLERSAEFNFSSNQVIMHQGESGAQMLTPSYGRKSAIMVSGNGRIIHGWSEHLFFKFFDSNGEYLNALFYPKEKLPLNRNEILNEYSDHSDRDISMIRSDEMPETLPAYSTVHIDNENRFWLARFTENSDEWNWWVLNSDGELSATFKWPRSKVIRHINNDYIYTRESDEETGLVEIVKYEIKL